MKHSTVYRPSRQLQALLDAGDLTRAAWIVLGVWEMSNGRRPTHVFPPSSGRASPSFGYRVEGPEGQGDRRIIWKLRGTFHVAPDTEDEDEGPAVLDDMSEDEGMPVSAARLSVVDDALATRSRGPSRTRNLEKFTPSPVVMSGAPSLFAPAPPAAAVGPSNVAGGSKPVTGKRSREDDDGADGGVSGEDDHVEKKVFRRSRRVAEKPAVCYKF